jgi:hypothetical protein
VILSALIKVAGTKQYEYVPKVRNKTIPGIL